MNTRNNFFRQISEVCVYHMQSKYKKAGGRRSELQGAVAAPIAQKFKNTIWNKVEFLINNSIGKNISII